MTATYRHWRLLSRDEILARQEKEGDDKCTVANNTRGGQRSLSQIAYELSEKREGGGTRHIKIIIDRNKIYVTL